MGNDNFSRALQNTPSTSRYPSNTYLDYLNNKHSNTVSNDCSF